jgi:hypothetical protein
MPLNHLLVVVGSSNARRRSRSAARPPGRPDALSAQLRSHQCAAARPAVGPLRACRIGPGTCDYGRQHVHANPWSFSLFLLSFFLKKNLIIIILKRESNELMFSDPSRC